MNLYLVRHAKAYSRSSWIEADDLRPLTPAGILQSHSIATAIAGEHPARLLSSSYARCYQTLLPLSRELGLRMELEPRLAEGSDPRQVLGLLEGFDETGAVVLCSHGDVIPALLRLLGAEGLDDGFVPCKKGSFWRVEWAGRRGARATYWLPRPASETSTHGVGGRDARRLAAVDLGSSSFHLLVADAEPGGTLHRVGRERVMLRLGAMISDGGRITAAARARAVETADRMRADAEQAGAEQLLPVATAALRDATNSAEVIADLERALSAPVRVLSGEQEAHLVFRALRQRLGLHQGITLGLDLGGGSLELAVGDAEQVLWECSLPLGTVRLHHELGPADPLKEGDRRAIAERVCAELDPRLSGVRDLAPERAVAIGGPVRGLFRLLRAFEVGPNGRIPIDGELETAEIVSLSERLGTLTSAQRRALPGIPERRVDLLPTGAVIVATVAQRLGLERMRVCDWGLREGVILEAIQNGASAA